MTFRGDPDYKPVMTNALFLWILAIVLILLGVDWYVFDWTNSIFLLRKGAEFSEWIAFWR